MESTRRPQRQRRVPSRFLDGVKTPLVAKDAAVCPLPRRARPSGVPEQSTKRWRGSARKEVEGQASRGTLAQVSHPDSPAGEVTSAAGSASRSGPVLDLPASGGRTASGQAAPEAQAVAPANSGDAKQGGTTSDDSDVMIVDPAPATKLQVGEQKGTSPVSPQLAHQGAQCRRILPNSGAQASPLGFIAPAPTAAVPTAAEVRAPVVSLPSMPRSGSTHGATCTSPQAAQSSTHAAPQEARSGAPSEPPASPLPVGPSTSPSSGLGPVPDIFQPLFQREATPPRPDFSAGNDNASDSDSDGFNILAARGRRGKKAAVRPPQRSALLDASDSPAGSSPGGSGQGTPAQRGGVHDTSWLKPPSPELPARDGRTSAVPESATLLRLRQQRAELLALARGASLAPDRIQAQSTAEALERELQRDAALREAQAAASHSKDGPEGSDTEDGGAGTGPAAREQGSGEQSVLVKVRASDGSQERFKVRCSDPLEKLFRAYIKKVHPGGSPAGAAFSFVFDGDPIDDKSTPEALGLEDDDIIEVVRTKRS